MGSWPTINLARFGLDRLPPLGWLFVGAAVLVAVLDASRVASSSPETLPSGVAWWGTSVIGAALPAVLVWRVPRGDRLYPVLFGGLALGTVVSLIRGVTIAWPQATDGAGWMGSPLDYGYTILLPIASVLVGLGLVRLLGRVPRRFGLFVVLAAVFLGTDVGMLWLSAATTKSIYSFGPIDVLHIAGVPLASLFVVWVAVSAWLDHAPNHEFWTCLALALPFNLVGLAFSVPESIAATVLRSNALLPAAVTLSAGSNLVIALLAAYAYGRLIPMAPPEDRA